jgi:prepilin-type N-terminal cleavage/methylation domain-containing protein
MKIKPTGRSGFTLTEIMIVVGIVALLAEVSIPSYLEARGSAQARICMANLRQIDNAKQQWALESLRNPADVPTTADLAQYVMRGVADDGELIIICPLDSAKTYDTSYDTLDLMVAPECKQRPLRHFIQ